MATYNGAGTLPKVLDAYKPLHAPPGGWKLIIVDNASNDRTPDILAGHRDALPLLPMRTESRGKNLALNCGLAHVEGDLIVFTDDDAVPEPEWLVEMRTAADEQGEYDIFAGGIDPLWPTPCPEWILRLVNLGATFGLTPPSLHSGPVRASQAWGANMAIRRSVFDAGHRFNNSVGPQAGHYVMGSEVELTGRLEGEGRRTWFHESARVGHIIRPHQLEREWIVQRAFRLGRHMFHQERPEFGSTPLLRGAPRWKYRLLLRQLLRGFSARVFFNADERFLSDWEIAFLRGYLTEAASIAQQL
jgi:L-malate glycosyltransferase